MSPEPKRELHLEVAHVLFMDVVGFSKLLINDQTEILEQLNQLVRDAPHFREADAAGKLIRLATGDGMALVFSNSAEAPVECALEISEALKIHPHIKLRMGIHSGPVNAVSDVNDRSNVTGAGINMAQRVMDCGDAGHILLSRHVAEDLEQYRQWQPCLHDLGECEVKHGARVHVFNLYTDGVGNPEVPEKLQQAKAKEQTLPGAATSAKFAGSRAWIAALVIGAAAIAVAGFYIFSHRSSTKAILEKSIAVLPFENLSEDKANAYFADGIQDEILTRLSKIADLKVISRTSTQHYKSAPENLPEIASQLGVAHILEGSVQKSGDAVRVNVQLIKAVNDSHLWAETFDRKLTDIFEVESEIAKRIVESLQAKLTGGEQQALAVKPTNNPEAYDAYLRGRAFEARTSSSFDLLMKAIGFYERAVQLDPNFAFAWARLSRVNAFLYFNRIDTASAARRDAAKRALENAQKLEPNSPETLLALGYYQYWVLLDYDSAKTTFGRVSKMLPGNSEVPTALGLIARRGGHWDQSIAYLEQALALDPRSVELLTQAAETYSMVRQFPAALKLYDRALDIMPNDPDVMAAKASIYQAEGNLQEAAKLLADVNAKTSSGGAFETKIIQLRFERNYGEAVRLLQARLAQFHYPSEIEWGINQVTLAIVQRLAGDAAGAKTNAEQARNTLKQLYGDQPDNLAVRSEEHT